MTTKAPDHGHRFAVYSPTGINIGLWEDGFIAGQVAAEEGRGYTVSELVTADLHAAVVAERDALREALQSVLAACDQGRMVPRPGCGIGGMTIEANIRGSIYNGVPAWPVEEARAALAKQEPKE